MKYVTEKSLRPPSMEEMLVYESIMLLSKEATDGVKSIDISKKTDIYHHDLYVVLNSLIQKDMILKSKEKGMKPVFRIKK